VEKIKALLLVSSRKFLRKFAIFFCCLGKARGYEMFGICYYGMSACQQLPKKWMNFRDI